MSTLGHRTLAGRARFEPEPIKGSRHIGTAGPVGDESEARALIESVRRELPKATHHAFAWRLAPDGTEHRCSDDGEPGGTAGRPILRQLEALGLLDVCVVVTRFFGGVKLGAGGLARAYSGAARAVLEHAEIVDVIPHVDWTIRIDYAGEQVVRQCLARHGVVDFAVTHATDVSFAARVPMPACDALASELRERTQGRARVVGPSAAS
ncbi:MAG: YigZ family protein [Planctomycetes bacterium]|nr:YigZ family protein [Planctomycetota bacterium]